MKMEKSLACVTLGIAAALAPMFGYAQLTDVSQMGATVTGGAIAKSVHEQVLRFLSRSRPCPRSLAPSLQLAPPAFGATLPPAHQPAPGRQQQPTEASQLGGLRFHDLRHTWVSWCMVAGVSLQQL
jgi:hypothetical protein